jgi:hypothetical protein
LTGTSATYGIPLSSKNATIMPYDWIVNWGDDSGVEVATGSTTGDGSGAILHTYDAPGQYQITILPNGAATASWLRAYGSSDLNAYLPAFRSIDTPFSPLAISHQVQIGASTFSNVFFSQMNGIGIPENLFANVSTAGRTSFSNFLISTFRGFARNSTTAIIPAGLLDFLDTTSGGATAFGWAFAGIFWDYGDANPNITIPPGLLDSIDLTNAISCQGTFQRIFSNFADNNTSATIPPGLFDHLNARNCNTTHVMFNHTFNGFAPRSTVGTIPEGLFDSVVTSNTTIFIAMFSNTFTNYAAASTVGVIPEGLFDTIDTSRGTAIHDPTDSTGPFNNVFLNYATRTATFKVGGAVVGTQSFAGPYASKNISQ